QSDLGKHRSLVDQFLLLGFGTSGSELTRSYLVTLLGEEQLDKQKVILLELTPKSDDVRKQISKIHLWIDEATWLPAQQKFIETGSEDYFVIRYTNVVRNRSEERRVGEGEEETCTAMSRTQIRRGVAR